MEIVTYKILFLSLSLSWVSAGSYLPYQAVYVCTYVYIFHLSHLQVLIFIDNFQISSYLSLTLLR